MSFFLDVLCEIEVLFDTESHFLSHEKKIFMDVRIASRVVPRSSMIVDQRSLFLR
eukprot:UN27240